jgi:UDP-2,3-diacylglucosamine hydrolase
MSTFCSISDVHIRNSEDSRYKDLLKFLETEQVQKADLIIFLGDIFDLMVGNHSENYQEYSYFFKKLDRLSKSGKRLIYFEGNHDLHLTEFFKTFLPFIELRKKPLKVMIGKKNFYFSHGDEFDLQNTSYQNYKRILNMRVFQRLANYIVPFSFVQKIGTMASSFSRKRNHTWDSSQMLNLKERYIKNISGFMNEDIDFVIFGHSHIVEDGNSVLANSNIKIYNNGFFPETNEYIYGSEAGCTLIPIN